ncbi:MAG: hypothetical protein SVY10_21355 [Thermodesulfobacteriota bacterium]|nr:hypothetical protein [Thermodesulfobacteriota bacterium]
MPLHSSCIPAVQIFAFFDFVKNISFLGEHYLNILMVYAKTDPDAGIRGISAFVMKRGTPGFYVSRKEKMM